MKSITKTVQLYKLQATLVAGILLMTFLSGCSSHQARMQEMTLQFQENARQRAEATKLRQEEYARRQDERYTAWFNSLSRDQQVAIANEKERTQRTEKEATGRILGGAIEGIGNYMRPKYYVVE